VEPATAWVVSNSSGISCAWFAYEADARAFVALPALIDAAKAIANRMLTPEFRWPQRDSGLPLLYACNVDQWADDLLAALAAADGPSPQQEKKD
jgi:hypothetical protein